MICSFCVTTFGDTESLYSHQKEVHDLPRPITALNYGDKQPTITANNATTPTTKQRLKDHNCFMYGLATVWHRKVGSALLPSGQHPQLKRTDPRKCSEANPIAH